MLSMPRRHGDDARTIKARWDRVADLTRRGVPADDIAHQLGMHIRTVYRIRGKYGLNRVGAPRPFTDAELTTAQTMLDDGASIAEVARTLGRCPKSVWRKFPGRGWDATLCAEFGALHRHGRPGSMLRA